MAANVNEAMVKELGESPLSNAGSIPARWPRFGKGKQGSNPCTRVNSRVADGSVGLTAGKDRQPHSLGQGVNNK